MKILAFIVFFTIALSILFGINYYIFIHGLKAFGTNPTSRWIYTVGFIFLASAYILGRILERVTNGVISRSLDWLGSYWLGAMVYFLLIVIAIDLFRVINHYLPLIPLQMRRNPAALNFYLGIASLIVVAGVLMAGRWNATHPLVRPLEVNIARRVAGVDSMKIAFVSDIHLGSIVGQRQLRQMVEIINAMRPDVILFGGDLLDEDLTPVIHRNIGQCLEELKAPLGAYAIPGNHECYGGIVNATAYLESHSIRVLRDSVVKLANGVYIVGREDRDGKRITGQTRRSLADLMQTVDPAAPIVVLDHQPVNLPETVAAGVDLQLSGHTHHGQLWPFNYMTAKVYQISRGYRQIGKTHFFVSSGYGTWGPPVRLASRSEIIGIVLHFKAE